MFFTGMYQGFKFDNVNDSYRVKWNEIERHEF